MRSKQHIPLILAFSLGTFMLSGQVLEDPSFELIGQTLGNGGAISPYPIETGGWSAADTDGEVFSEGTPYGGDWYIDLLQNASANPDTPWDESTSAFVGYDRIVTELTELEPNTQYSIRFYHSTQLNRFGYIADQTLVQLQSVQSDQYISLMYTTPSTDVWVEENIVFTTDSETTSMFLLFSPIGTINASVSIDGIDATEGVFTTLPQYEEQFEFSLFPNPTIDFVTIKVAPERYTMMIYDNSGRLVLEEVIAGDEEYVLSLTAIRAGTYRLVLENSKGVQSQRQLIKY